MHRRTSNKDAQKAYRKKQEEITKLMVSIQRKLRRHTGESVHWGHVGDLGHVEELLSQIDEFLG